MQIKSSDAFQCLVQPSTRANRRVRRSHTALDVRLTCARTLARVARSKRSRRRLEVPRFVGALFLRGAWRRSLTLNVIHAYFRSSSASSRLNSARKMALTSSRTFAAYRTAAALGRAPPRSAASASI